MALPPGGAQMAALGSLSFRSGAGITVFLDPPAVAKASGVWRRRAGLLA